jgi:hypothetical protein
VAVTLPPPVERRRLYYAARERQPSGVPVISPTELSPELPAKMPLPVPVI